MTKRRPTILLMDEDADMLEQLQTALQREGFYVQVAADGHAALRLAQRTPPDLIISEVLLAGLDGYEVWRTLRSDKQLPRIPVLVVSALAIPPSDTPWRPNSNANWQILAYDAFLPKPVDLRRFVRVVKKLVDPDQSSTIPGGASVMVAIDEPDLQYTLAQMLREHDFEVETPGSLAQAQRQVTVMPPGVLILDYRQQPQAVSEMVRLVKNIAANTVIILLVNPDQEIEPDILARCMGFVTPSLHPGFILSTINQILNLSTMCRRTELLSNRVITANQNLVDAQHTLQAQNEELQYVNAQLRELDSLKETLTGMVIHDLKTPLSAILGAISFLSTDPDVILSPITENLLTGAMAAGNQMVRLTETLLESQRLEHGHLEPDSEPFHFPTIVDVSLKQLASLLTLHRVTVDVNLEPEHLPLAYADPHISQRILENLLDNAIKFSPRNGKITMEMVQEGNFLRISVSDQGPGIPKEDQQTIFEQFAQLKREDSSYSRGGFGLGLTFCHLAAHAMGGTIWVESDGQSGTKFSFTIPIFVEQ